MSHIPSEQPSIFSSFDSLEDTFATADLLKAARAFNYIVKSEEIYDRISLSDDSTSPEFVTPVQAAIYYADKLVLKGINRIREARADRLYAKGQILFMELEEREVELH
jgi:hypothetical protein